MNRWEWIRTDCLPVVAVCCGLLLLQLSLTVCLQLLSVSVDGVVAVSCCICCLSLLQSLQLLFVCTCCQFLSACSCCCFCLLLSVCCSYCCCLSVVAIVTVLLYAEGQILLSLMPSSWTKLCLTMKFPSMLTANWQLSENHSQSKVSCCCCCAVVFLSISYAFITDPD